MRDAGTATHILTLHSMRCGISGLCEPQSGRGAGSFTNDGRGYFSANARFVSTENVLTYVPPDKRVPLRDLVKGEEVYYDYGEAYWTFADTWRTTQNILSTMLPVCTGC